MKFNILKTILCVVILMGGIQSKIVLAEEVSSEDTDRIQFLDLSKSQIIESISEQNNDFFGVNHSEEAVSEKEDTSFVNKMNSKDKTQTLSEKPSTIIENQKSNTSISTESNYKVDSSHMILEKSSNESQRQLNNKKINSQKSNQITMQKQNLPQSGIKSYYTGLYGYILLIILIILINKNKIYNAKK